MLRVLEKHSGRFLNQFIWLITRKPVQINNTAYNYLIVGLPINRLLAILLISVEGEELTYHRLHLAGNIFEAVWDVEVMYFGCLISAG